MFQPKQDQNQTISLQRKHAEQPSPTQSHLPGQRELGPILPAFPTAPMHLRLREPPKASLGLLAPSPREGLLPNYERYPHLTTRLKCQAIQAIQAIPEAILFKLLNSGMLNQRSGPPSFAEWKLVFDSWMQLT